MENSELITLGDFAEFVNSIQHTEEIKEIPLFYNDKIPVSGIWLGFNKSKKLYVSIEGIDENDLS